LPRQTGLSHPRVVRNQRSPWACSTWRGP